MMRHSSTMKPFLILSATCAFLALPSCVGTLNTGGNSNTKSVASTGSSDVPVARQKLNKHDIALRFLTAYIRLDRNMALQYATPTAVSKLDWNRRHSGNIPYYDDKMILHFNGGWARVYFQEVGGSYLVSDLDVHRR